MSPRCPNCESSHLQIAYSIRRIPVHSTINLSTRQSAINFPTGNLELGFCPGCGFLSNTVYDASLQKYSEQCEESQHVSETFNRFARELTARWIEQYDLRNKTILEIGCGKGEFLALLCEMGDNRGIGIDPSCQPARTAHHAEQRIRFIQDLYSEQYAHLEADCILCRHTLEHIGPTLDFIRMIRRAIGDRKNIIVLFELPDVVRILKEAAFWDIYYEHCSYFSPGSLARAFRAAHFDVIELKRDYADQYLLLAARPADAATLATLPLENDLEQMVRLVEQFRNHVPASIRHWRDLIQSAHAKGKRIVLWSALSKAVSFLTTLQVGEAIEFAVDINPHRQGRFLPGTGQQIMPPSFLSDYRPDIVILMNPIYVPEVRRDLDAMQVQAEILPVGVHRFV